MSSSVEIGRLTVTKDVIKNPGVKHMYFNATDKVIKYLTFFYVPYNQVGDPVQCTISRKSEVSCKLTGPIEPHVESVVDWESLWRNPTVSRVELVRLYIEYMDGTDETINGADVVSISDENSVYYEKIAKPRAAERAEREKKEAAERAEREKQKAIEAAEAARKADLKQPYLCFKVFKSLKKAKKDEEIAFHANQGLWLFILEVLGVIAMMLGQIGTAIGLALVVIAIVFASKCCKAIDENKRYELPIIGKIKLIK